MIAPRGTTLFLAAMLAAVSPASLAAQERSGHGESAESDAVEELVTDRPDVTESTSIVPVGWLQAETGASFERENGSVEALAFPGTLLRLGISPRLEARLGWEGYQDLDQVSGAADGEASLKILLLERQASRPDLAVLPAITVPVGEDPFTSDEFDPGVKLLLANDVSEGVGWGANLGVAWPSEAGEREVVRRALYSWSLSFGFDLGPNVGAFLEGFGESPAGGRGEQTIDGGLIFQATPHLQLDASGGVGLDEDAPDWFVGTGFAFRFGL